MPHNDDHKKKSVRRSSTVSIPGKKAGATIKVDKTITEKPVVKKKSVTVVPKKRTTPVVRKKTTSTAPRKRRVVKKTPPKSRRVKFDVPGLGSKGIEVKSESGKKPEVNKVDPNKKVVTKKVSSKTFSKKKLKITKPKKIKGSVHGRNKTRKCPTKKRGR